MIDVEDLDRAAGLVLETRPGEDVNFKAQVAARVVDSLQLQFRGHLNFQRSQVEGKN